MKFESNSSLVSPEFFGMLSVVTDDVDADLVTSLAFGIGNLRFCYLLQSNRRLSGASSSLSLCLMASLTNIIIRQM